MSLSIERVSRSFPRASAPAVDGVSLEVRDGEFFSLLGPSGCGKTTLLRIVAGLETADKGRIMIKGKPMDRVRARDRDVAMVFQNYALYPHMTVERNLAFGLRVRGDLPRAEVKAQVGEVAEALRIADLLKRKPGELSGGEQQRVALGRALIRRPAVFLMDEPLSNLDLKLREEMRTELKELHRQFGITTIFVTHDQTEAMSLSDRLAVMRAGRVEQLGEPQNFFDSPANMFVAAFIGSPSINFFHMTWDASLTSAWSEQENDRRFVVNLPMDIRQPSGAKVVVGIRPQQFEVLDRPRGAEDLFVDVEFVEHFGDRNMIVCRPDEPTRLTLLGQRLLVVVAPTVNPRPGTPVCLRPRPTEMLSVFDVESGDALHPTPPDDSAGDPGVAASGGGVEIVGNQTGASEILRATGPHGDQTLRS